MIVIVRKFPENKYDKTPEDAIEKFNGLDFVFRWKFADIPSIQWYNWRSEVAISLNVLARDVGEVFYDWVIFHEEFLEMRREDTIAPPRIFTHVQFDGMVILLQGIVQDVTGELSEFVALETKYPEII